MRTSSIGFITVLGALLILSVQGCSKIDSKNLKTAGMYAKLNATDNGTSMTAKASLSTSWFSTDTIALSNGDTLLATFAGQTLAMTGHTSGLGEHYYTAKFNTTGPNQLVNIDFQRSDGSSAPNSSVTLPPGLTLTSPSSGTVFHILNNDTININWTSTSTSAVTIDFSCNWSTSNASGSSDYSTTVTTGSYSTTVNTLLSSLYGYGTSTLQNASVTVTVSRSSSGSVDSNYGQGGYFDGSEERSVSFSIQQ